VVMAFATRCMRTPAIVRKIVLSAITSAVNRALAHFLQHREESRRRGGKCSSEPCRDLSEPCGKSSEPCRNSWEAGNRSRQPRRAPRSQGMTFGDRGKRSTERGISFCEPPEGHGDRLEGAPRPVAPRRCACLGRPSGDLNGAICRDLPRQNVFDFRRSLVVPYVLRLRNTKLLGGICPQQRIRPVTSSAQA
jgi:hypothetical protein